MAKVATYVELEAKEITNALIDIARKQLKSEPGGSSVTYHIEDGELLGACVRFGSKFDRPPKLPPARPLDKDAATAEDLEPILDDSIEIPTFPKEDI